MRKSKHLTKRKLNTCLGDALRAARQETELTQADVAKRVGMVIEVYGRMECGLLMPSVPSLRRLCLALRMDANAALGLGAREGANWLVESAPPPSEAPPRQRRLVRALRQLGDDQFAAVGAMVHTLTHRS